MDAKNILAVDTSSRALSVVLRKGKDNIFEGNLEGTPRHSEQLMGLIRDGLKRLKLPKEELNSLIWGVGPGSFTGLRIGLSVLKGLHLGLRKKAFGASSLDAIALGAGVASGKLAVCVDARREHLYVALYQFQNGDVRKALQDSVLSLDAFLKKVDAHTVFAGDGLAVYGDLIRKRVGKKALFLEPTFWYPRALFLVKLWDEKRKWLKPLTLRSMIPKYLRVSEAEERFGLPR